MKKLCSRFGARGRRVSMVYPSLTGLPAAAAAAYAAFAAGRGYANYPAFGINPAAAAAAAGLAAGYPTAAGEKLAYIPPLLSG